MDPTVFASLSEAELRSACPGAACVEFAHGSPLYHQGALCPDVFCVQRGQVKLGRVSRDGRELTVDLLLPGELFGPRLGHPAPHPAQETAVAKGDVMAWRVPAAEFDALLASRADVGTAVVSALARRQRRIERRLECFVFKQTETRLADTLRELSAGFEPRCEHGFGLHIRLSQQELADLVGATRPVVSTILNRLRRRGVLGYSREYVCVRDIDVIEQMVAP